jgi:hypothetical protein
MKQYDDIRGPQQKKKHGFHGERAVKQWRGHDTLVKGKKKRS